MVESQQVANLMDERCFKVISIRRTVGGKLQCVTLCRSRMRIYTDVGFCNHPRLRIIENPRPPCRRTCTEERFVFGRVGNCQEICSVTSCGLTDRGCGRHSLNECNVRHGGPARESSTRGAYNVGTRLYVGTWRTK